MTVPRLDVDGVSRSFGGIRAVRAVSFALEPGRITGLIGPNGAGKTTLFNLIAGTLKPDEGRIRFEGRALAGLGPGAVARLGLARSFQATSVFPGLSVREHLHRAALLRHAGRPADLLRWRVLAAARRAAGERAAELLDFAGLAGVAETEAAALPYGLQKILGVVMALAGGAHMLLADEPAAGLNPTETLRMGALLRAIHRKRGVDILLIEHDLRMVMALCDRIVALGDGAVIADGPPALVRRDPAFVAAYLGGDADAA
ncbi:ABC transporter ATP-binding protein [Azospirillum doebereinerae]|uniref:ABC transporter ATP-binding protein n=1 Tax=Azospirillum doebereinerae TaxID=92933 RepID=A0A3S0WJU9_9PROT|nr:ABC transporter ATP-binding protein [Azospirillum doebereinerae]MCG5238321.1 ABC transporter ATP-binding protein [Azospirillum doebereinerae]RUQ66796.1 ABC transporter ATP-binding protein [Azospirillum doebereinerae]